MASCMTFASCMDNNFDLSDVDVTMGFGSESLTLPGNNSTKEILLDDVLELDDSDFILTQENGDYVFFQEGDEVEATKVSVDEVNVSEDKSDSYDIHFSIPSGVTDYLVEEIDLAEPISKDMDVKVFEFSGNPSADVKDIYYAKANSGIELVMRFSANLAGFVSEMDYIHIDMPDFLEMELEDGMELLAGNIIKMKNVSTDNEVTIHANIKGLDFDERFSSEKQYLKFDQEKRLVTMKGAVNVSAAFSKVRPYSGDANDCSIICDVNIGEFALTEVTGRFSPSIDMDNIGNFTINSVPDFLKGDGINVDLYNPRLTLEVTSDIDVDANIDGTIKALDERGELLAEVPVKGIKINRNGISKVLICRQNPTEVAPDITQVLPVPELSTLVETIPQSISFSAEVEADETKEGIVKLGHEYTIKPSYTFEAPLAFAENACIVYSDETESFEDDLSDIDVMGDASVEISAKVVNKVPAFLAFNAFPLDKDGNEISANDLEVKVEGFIPACENGKTSVESELHIVIAQKTSKAIQKLDKVKYTVTATATHNGESVTGIALNKQTQTIIMKDIKVTLKGKVIADLN